MVRDQKVMLRPAQHARRHCRGLLRVVGEEVVHARAHEAQDILLAGRIGAELETDSPWVKLL